MSQISIAQAAFLTGKSRQTINKFTNNGKLSSSLNAEGAKVIDISELQRVLPLVRKIEELDQMEAAGEEGANEAHALGLAEELAVLRVRLEGAVKERDRLEEERRREREQYQRQIDSLQTSLDKVQDQHSKAMLILTDQSEGRKNGDLDQGEVVRQLTEKIERLGQQNKTIYRKLKEQEKKEQEKGQRGFWRWLTGGGEASPSPEAKKSASA